MAHIPALNLASTPSPRRPARHVSTPISDISDRCGGSKQLSGYEMVFASGLTGSTTAAPAPVTNPSPTTPPTPSPTDVDRVGTYEAVGCFSDATRIMVKKDSRKELMSASVSRVGPSF